MGGTNLFGRLFVEFNLDGAGNTLPGARRVEVEGQAVNPAQASVIVPMAAVFGFLRVSTPGGSDISNLPFELLNP